MNHTHPNNIYAIYTSCAAKQKGRAENTYEDGPRPASSTDRIGHNPLSTIYISINSRKFTNFILQSNIRNASIFIALQIRQRPYASFLRHIIFDIKA